MPSWSGARWAAGCSLPVWGGYALDLQITGKLDVAAILNGAGGIPATVQAILGTLPMSGFITGAFILLCFIFLATTLDSAAYVLASVTSKELSGYQEPKRSLRMIWALILAAVGAFLIQIGGLKPVQTSTIIVALPLDSGVVHSDLVADALVEG